MIFVFHVVASIFITSVSVGWIASPLDDFPRIPFQRSNRYFTRAVDARPESKVTVNNSFRDDSFERDRQMLDRDGFFPIG